MCVCVSVCVCVCWLCMSVCLLICTMPIYIYISMYVCALACVCVCMHFQGCFHWLKMFFGHAIACDELEIKEPFLSFVCNWNWLSGSYQPRVSM